MIAFAPLWVCLVAAEGLGYARLPLRRSVWRTAWIVLLLVCSLLSTTLGLQTGWQTGVLVGLLGAYRLVNLGRFWYARLPEPRLRTACLRAHWWLVGMQAACLVIGSVAAHWHLGGQLLDSLVALQLTVALLLLRSTVHTWRHAAAPSDTRPLTDRELPSLSVLVLARNETTELEKCLELLAASDYPKLEILALDDCSVTRRTPDIIRSFAQAGVRFVPGQPPDETRWLAKNYGYEQLAKEASGELLLFCGVDALLEPGSLHRLVETLEARGKTMLSVLPLRRKAAGTGSTLYQAMRYYWELCLPRRLFKRPPVLSTCWLIRADALRKMGGFEAVRHSVSPEAAFARQAVITDGYSFIRSSEHLGIYSSKPAAEQYGTSVRVRYPQLHRRLELVAAVTLLEATFLLGPLVGLLVARGLRYVGAYTAVWGVSLLCLIATYAFAAIGARLANPWYGWIGMPVAFVLDVVILHVSLWQYEFGTVKWKGRNVCLPVMQLDSRTVRAQQTK